MHSLNIHAIGMANRAKATKGRNKNTERRLYIKEWRKFRGLSQEKLGSLIGQTQGAISQLELYAVDFTLSTLEALAKALNCTVRDLLYRPPEQAENIADIVDDISDSDRPRALEILKTFKKTAS